MSYDLTSKSSRRIGMSRQHYQFRESLHKPRPQIKNINRALSPEVDAPPASSSEDEASIVPDQDATLGGHVEGSSENCRSRSGSQNIAKPGRSVRSSPQNSRGELYIEPSNIPPSNFLPRNTTESCNGSQGSQKRSSGVADEDEDTFGMYSQGQKRQKTTYGGSSQRSLAGNIHHSSSQNKVKKPIEKTNAAIAGDGKTFRFLNGYDDAMAKGMYNVFKRFN